MIRRLSVAFVKCLGQALLIMSNLSRDLKKVREQVMWPSGRGLRQAERRSRAAALKWACIWSVRGGQGNWNNTDKAGSGRRRGENMVTPRPGGSM